MFVVVTRSTFSPDVETEALALAKRSVPIAKAQVGFVDMVVHLNHARTQIMTYWKWRNQSDHQACMDSDAWCALMPGWEKLIADGKLKFDMETYDVLFS